MKQLSKNTIALLEDIEDRIDPETEADFEDQWRNFLFDRFHGDLFSPKRSKLSASLASLDPIENINDAVGCYDHMLRHQLQDIASALNSTSRNLCIRANYGTGILSSVFGAEIFHMPRHTNTLPTTKPFNDTELIRAKVEEGMPNLKTGFGQNVFEFGEFCAEVFAHYPKIQKYVKVYHPDLQGPLDICELLWGGEMFYAMYDEPELVHAMLELVTDTYEAFMDQWHSIFPADPEMNPHWSYLYHRGAIMLRNDSAMNLSPDLYREFAAPYDGRLLRRYGGAVHFCGRGDHYIKTLCSLPGLHGIQMSQPHLNNMEIIYQNTVDRGIRLLSLKRETAQQALSRPGGVHQCISC